MQLGANQLNVSGISKECVMLFNESSLLKYSSQKRTESSVSKSPENKTFYFRQKNGKSEMQQAITRTSLAN